MISKSKLDTFVSQSIDSLKDKSLFLRESFLIMVALLLLGFLVGNLFGTFLNILRRFFFLDVFIIFLLIGLLEILNYNVYCAKKRLFFSKKTVQFLNLFKIGLMIGFFVDAFKVGS